MYRIIIERDWYLSNRTGRFDLTFYHSVQRQRAGVSVHAFHRPAQDFLHYLSAVIAGYQEHFDFRMAWGVY